MSTLNSVYSRYIAADYFLENDKYYPECTVFTVLTLLKKLFLHSNSTHQHKIINHIHIKLHTDVKNVKHYSRVSFACSESSEEQALSHTVHANKHCTYSI